MSCKRVSFSFCSICTADGVNKAKAKLADFSLKRAQHRYTRKKAKGILCISLLCQSFSFEQEELNRRWGHSFFYMIMYAHTCRLPVKAHLSSATIKQLCLCWPDDCFILNHPIISTNTLTQTQTHLLSTEMAWQWFILGNSCCYGVGRQFIMKKISPQHYSNSCIFSMLTAIKVDCSVCACVRLFTSTAILGDGCTSLGCKRNKKYNT